MAHSKILLPTNWHENWYLLLRVWTDARHNHELAVQEYIGEVDEAITI